MESINKYLYKPWPHGVQLIAGPFTPASLLALAESKEAEYRELLDLHPAGTINVDRNRALDLSRVAFACANWMNAGGHAELAHVGPFHSFRPRRGQKVRVKKGSVVFSTNPKVPIDGAPTARDQVVVVHNIVQGFVEEVARLNKSSIRQGLVKWVGAGGYWRWTELNNVELLEPCQNTEKNRNESFCAD